MRCTMLLRRSAIKENLLKAPIKLSDKVKTIKIDKTKLIHILNELRELKETDLINSLLETTMEQDNRELEEILLKTALINVGFIPGKDDSFVKFYEMLYFYKSDSEVKEYLSYVSTEANKFF
jgi:hypothetical protein